MPEFHYVNRARWLRAAVLGANDGIVSTASLILGVDAANGGRKDILIAALAGWAAGAMSMAAGEYVSVSSQADSEGADLAREERALRESPTAETMELVRIYEGRGLSRGLAEQVAAELMANDALAAHARDEIRLAEGARARPTLAASASAAAYSIGAALPILTALFTVTERIALSVPAAALASLAALGMGGAKLCGAPLFRPAWRSVASGALAMAVTAAVGAMVGGIA